MAPTASLRTREAWSCEMKMLERVIRTVTAAKEIAERNAAAARTAGNEADAAQFDAAALDAQQRLVRLRESQDSSQASTWGWWM
jgi:hypothetical protein